MIQVTQHPLPDPQVTLLRQWLNNPACFEFQRYVSNLAAHAAAEAGNLLERAEEGDDYDAKKKAQEARNYTALNKLIVEMRDQDYKFHPFELKAEIVTTT